MSSADDVARMHTWIARAGVLAIAVVAFLFVYDAGVSWGAAVGWRPGLARLWPWLIEGFMALVVYAGWLIKTRGGSLRYPAGLFFALLAVGGYVNFRVHTNPHSVRLTTWETGTSATLPVLILACAVHLLLKTFEQNETTAAAEPAGLMHAVTASTVTAEPAEAAPVLDTFSGDELKALPAPTAAPQLRGQANFAKLAEEATDPRAREIWRGLAQTGDDSKGQLF